jgi:hypothetical protein
MLNPNHRVLPFLPGPCLRLPADARYGLATGRSYFRPWGVACGGYAGEKGNKILGSGC